MTYRDANGNMSSTIVREENKMATSAGLAASASAMKLVTQNSTRFKAMKQNRLVYLLKLKQAKKYLLK
jgi:mevalonate pyrophosphate decarboxylase